MQSKPKWENDPIHVAVWKQLIFFGFCEAAVGLLCDVFTLLKIVERSPVANVEVGKLRDDARANVREEAMIILADNDGQKLREWLDLFGTDESAFKARAREWVEHCGDADVFHLFD